MHAILLTDEMAQAAPLFFVHGHQRTGIIAESALRDEIACRSHFRFQVLRGPRDVDRAEIRDAGAAGGLEEVEAVFQILLVEMEKIGPRTLPVSGELADGWQVQVAGDRAPTMIVGVLIRRTQHFTE